MSKIPRKFGFKTKLTVLMLLVAYLSILLVSTSVYGIGNRTLSQQAEQSLKQTAEQTLSLVNRMIYERYNDMQILITDSNLVDPNVSLEAKTEILKSNLIKLGWYDDIYLASPEGKIIAATHDNALDYDVSDEKWFKTTQKDFIAVSDVLNSPFTNRKTIVLANTLATQNNEVIGIIFAEFSLNVINDLLEETPDSMEVFLYSQEGQLISYKSHLSPSEIPSLNDLKFLYTDRFVTTHLKSKGYLGFKGNGWQLVVRVPKNIAYQLLNQFTAFLLISVAVVSALVLLIGQVSSTNIVKPIRKLTDGVEKIGQGKLNQKIEIPNKDEIGFLAENFNTMAASLLKKTRNLLEEKGKYASILESSNEGIVLFNCNQKLIAFNKAFKDIFEKNDQDLNGKNMAEVLKFLLKKETVFATEQNYNAVSKLFLKDNLKSMILAELVIKKPKYKILTLYSKPVSSSNGELLGRIWVFHDVTQEREAEKSKNDFISVASHKLRTPLTAMKWGIQMLQDDQLGKLNKEQSKAMDEMTVHTNRLQNLVKILMTAAEINDEYINVKKEIFELKDLIKNSCEQAESHITDFSKIKISTPLEKDLNFNIHADQNKITQVLGSLLENAVLYSKDNEENNINVSIKPTQDGKRIMIMVKDQGIGIPNDEQHKVFTKFFRAKNALTKYTEGIGLNLYMAKIIVNSHKEKIWFDSKENEGSTFYFTISRHSSHPRSDKKSPPEENSPEAK